MSRIIANRAGRAVAAHAQRQGWLDYRLGLSLFRDRRVSSGAKFVAGLLGVGVVAALAALEFPLEAVLAFLPFGIGLDLLVDGLEVFILPFVFAGILLTHFAPRNLVDSVRSGY